MLLIDAIERAILAAHRLHNRDEQQEQELPKGCAHHQLNVIGEKTMKTDSITADWENRVAERERARSRPAAVSMKGIQPKKPCRSRKNVGVAERIASIAVGTALGFAGRQKGNMGGLLLALMGAGLLYRGAAGHCLCYDALGISTAKHNDNTAIPAKQGVKVEKTLTINRPASELYEFWRDITHLPQVFKHLKSVEVQDGNASHWVAAGPANMNVEWDAEILNDHEKNLIAWRSLPGGDIDTAGSIRFQPTKNDRGTEVTVSMKYNPPGGQVTDYLASWFGGGLGSKLVDDLRNFKSLMEAGEIPSTQGQPRGPS